MSATSIPDLTDPLQPILDDILDLLDDRVNHGLPVDSEDRADVIQVTGLEAVIDSCCPGLAWLRVVNTFPSTAFPAPATTRVGCPDTPFAAVLELGVARCACLLDEDTLRPDPDCLAEEAIQQGLDRAALIQTGLCDVPAMFRESPGSECNIVLGAWTPLDTQGGCFGGLIQVTIPYDQCCDDITPA